MFSDQFKSKYTTLPCATYAETFRFEDNQTGTQNVTHFHFHDEFEIILVEDGQIDYTVNNTKIAAQKGDILVLNPFDLHFAEGKKSHRCISYRCLDFDLSILSGLMEEALIDDIRNNQLRFRHLLPHAAQENAECAALIGHIFDCTTHKKAFWEYGVKAALLQLFYCLLSNGWVETESLSQKNLRMTAFAKSTLAYIKNNYMYKITSEDAANALSFERHYFCRLFRKTFQESFGNYLCFYRIGKARALLAEGESNLSRLAAAVCFDALSHFSTTFKKHLGLSPSAFQKSIKAEQP